MRWQQLYREADLYKAAVRLYTQPLFCWRKALFASTDQKDLYDFARFGLHNLESIHQALKREAFAFRPALALHREFRGKRRTLYVFPWEERLVDLLLYRLLSGRLQNWFSSNSYAYRLRGFGLDRCQRKISLILREARRPLFVVKRDVANYFPSVDHGLLRQQLAWLVEPHDYLFRLLEERMRFYYQEDGHLVRANRGIAFGTATASLFANVYLTSLDRRLDAIPGLQYFRYADDLILLAADRQVIEAARQELAAGLLALRLESKLSHQEDCVLCRDAEVVKEIAIDPQGFKPARKIRHLGLEFCSDGVIRLSRDKCRKIGNIFRFAFRRKRAKLARIREPRKRAEFLVSVARNALEQSVRKVAIVDYYLKHVNDELQLQFLDRWLAEEVLALTFNGNHRKAYFRQIPFAALRAMGLPSLVHRRRKIRHGQIVAPFFVWKSHQAEKSSRETAVKLRRCNARPQLSLQALQQ